MLFRSGCPSNTQDRDTNVRTCSAAIKEKEVISEVKTINDSIEENDEDLICEVNTGEP